jgi:hypothetical protein
MGEVKSYCNGNRKMGIILYLQDEQTLSPAGWFVNKAAITPSLVK